MKALKIQLLVVALGLGVFVGGTNAAPTAKSKPKPKPVFMTEIRADITDVFNGEIIAGGVAESRAPSGNLFAMTASIQARTRTVGKPTGASFSTTDVTGGGEYEIHQGATTIETGAWFVTGTAQVSELGGSLSGVIDAIGHTDQAIGGRIQVTAHLVPTSGSARDATLTLDCAVNSGRNLMEGFKLTDGSVTYTQFEGGGATLFHRWTQRVK